MRSLIAALLAGLFTFVLLALATRALYAIVPALAALAGVYVWLARKHGKAAEAIVLAAAEEIQNQRVEGAIEILKKAYAHTGWVFLLRGQIDGQIGAYRYIQRKFDEARPYLEKSWSKLWVAKGMLAADLFRRHKGEEAVVLLARVTEDNKKEALLYALRAYMLIKLKRREEAQKALAAGVAAVPGDKALQENLTRLQNGEDLRIHEFGEGWWQFHLERPTQKDIERMSGAGSIQQRVDRKSMYR